jgi:hypothetical protein
MLVVSANWAIADGTLVSHPRRLQAEWLAAVSRAAVRGGFRRDGRYAAIDRLDVVLAGDTFDALTTTAWLGGVRPWHEGCRAAGVAGRVLTAAAARGRRLLAGLAAWARSGVEVPAADRRGRPDAARRIRVPVRVAILPGDRDRWLAGAAARFARRGIAVAPSWSVDGVSVVHGAELDPFCCPAAGADVGRPTLGASLAVDLVARFGAAVRSLPGLWPECRPLVGRLAASRPLDLPLVVGEWLARLPVAAIGEQWRASVAAWRRQARLVDPIGDVGFDAIDAVAAWMDDLDPQRCAPGGVADLGGLLAEPAPVAAAAGVVVLGHRGPSVDATVVGLGSPAWRIAAEPCAGVRVACVAAAVPCGGPAHAVCLDPARPTWLPLGIDAAAAPAIGGWSRPAAPTHPIVEAA